MVGGTDIRFGLALRLGSIQLAPQGLQVVLTDNSGVSFSLGSYLSGQRYPATDGNFFEPWGDPNPESYGEPDNGSHNNREANNKRVLEALGRVVDGWRGAVHHRLLVMTRPQMNHENQPYSLAAFSIGRGLEPMDRTPAIAVGVSEKMGVPVYVASGVEDPMFCRLWEYMFRRDEDATPSREMAWDEVPYFLWSHQLHHNQTCEECLSLMSSSRRMGNHPISYEDDKMVLSNAMRRPPGVYVYPLDIMFCIHCYSPIAALSVSLDRESHARIDQQFMFAAAMRIPLVVFHPSVSTEGYPRAKGVRMPVVEFFHEGLDAPIYMGTAPIYTGTEEEVFGLMGSWNRIHDARCFGGELPVNVLTPVSYRAPGAKHSYRRGRL